MAVTCLQCPEYLPAAAAQHEANPEYEFLLVLMLTYVTAKFKKALQEISQSYFVSLCASVSCTVTSSSVLFQPLIGPSFFFKSCFVLVLFSPPDFHLLISSLHLFSSFSYVRRSPDQDQMSSAITSTPLTFPASARTIVASLIPKRVDSVVLTFDLN